MAAFDIIAVIDFLILILSNDSGAMSVVRWLLVCFVIALIMKPLFEFRGLELSDEGFSVSLGLGIAASFTVIYFFCTLTGGPFNSFTSVGGLILTALSVFLFRKKTGSFTYPKTRENNILVRKKRERFLVGFAVFSLLFLIAFWVKGFRPQIDFQTEQYMDYGFMTSMYRQRKMPFEDMWFTGRNINYYYLGQAVAVFMCRLSFVTPEYGYNLMLCTLFSSLMMTVYTVVEGFLHRIKEMNRSCSVSGGLAAALMCGCGGNGHWLKYGIFEPLLSKISGFEAGTGFFYPTSTMYIGYDPDTLDKGKHEFPSYTMVLGDLHAHMCNMLFTIPLLAVLFDYALDESGYDHNVREKKQDKDRNELDVRGYFGKIINKHTVAIGILLGLFRGVNYWDFPIYFIVAGAIILFSDIKRYGFKLSTVLNVLLKGAVILLIGAVIIFPFNLTYEKPISGIHLTDRHSPIGRLTLIWSVHVIMSLTLLISVFADRIIQKRKNTSDKKAGLTAHDVVIIAVTLCGLGLLAMPEFIYVKDIYGDEYQRFNTMFKLTFQGFILLSISAGICIGILINKGFKHKRTTGGTVLSTIGVLYLVTVLLLSGYIGEAVRQRLGNIFEKKNRWGISAVSLIPVDPLYDNVREVIDILNEDRSGQLHIIEEGGSSYSPENMVSVFTGASAPGGWYVHEWVWHNDSEPIRKRHDEVRAFYSLGDKLLCSEIAEKYKLDYIYVGPKVLEKYDVNYDGFSDLGDHIWESSDGSCMLIRVNR